MIVMGKFMNNQWLGVLLGSLGIVLIAVGILGVHVSSGVTVSEEEINACALEVALKDYQGDAYALLVDYPDANIVKSAHEYSWVGAKTLMQIYVEQGEALAKDRKRKGELVIRVDLGSLVDSATLKYGKAPTGAMNSDAARVGIGRVVVKTFY